MLPGLQWLPLDPDSLFAASLAVGAMDGMGAAGWRCRFRRSRAS